MDGTMAEAPEEMDQEEVAVKMSGYLEKRGKFRLVATWKRYWFVLEGRLLLYYGSEQDYINLSACRGSINMGLVSCVRPGTVRSTKQHDGFTIEVVTRTQLVVLRMKERSVQEQWLQALLDSMGGSSQAQQIAGSGGGTLHFRYSMDTLPTETKNEISTEEKQSTLPRPKHDSSKTRQQSIIRHIKRIGGKTYIGGLDAVLKIRNNAYGSEQEPILGNNTLNGHHVQKSQDKKELEEMKTSTDSSATDIVTKDTANCTSVTAPPKTLADNSHTQSHDSSLASDTNSCHQQAEVSLYNSEDYAEGMEGHEIGNCTSQTPVSKETLTISDYSGDLSDDDILRIKAEGVVTENKLYHQGNRPSYELYGSDNNLTALDCRSGELKICHLTDLAKAEIEEQHDDVAKSPVKLEEKHNSFTGSEDIYYSCYDKTSLMEQLKNEQLDSVEPELPPRPHMSPEPNENRTGSTSTVTEDDYDCAEYCTLDSVAPPHSPSIHSNSSIEDTVKKKEKKKFGVGQKKKKRSESTSENEDPTKVKRKISFIHKLMEKYHKKMSKHQNGTEVDTVQENDGTEYEVINYSEIPKETNKDERSTSKVNKQLASDDETHEKNATSMCSAKSILPNNTLHELQQRLKQRTNPHTQEESEEEEDYEVTYAECTGVTHEQDSSTTPSITRRKPVPVPRKNLVKSKEELTDDQHKGGAQQTPNTPPTLPPRRMIRPHSPWHDVPSNNAPVYGNYEELFGTRQRDSLLGTPEGYTMVKNKWQAAEMSNSPRSKGTQWTRELQQVKFPSRLGQRVLQWQEEAAGDPGYACCTHDDKELCSRHKATAVVERYNTDNVDHDTDATAYNGNGMGKFISGDVSQPSSLECDVKTVSVSKNSNKITLVATVHSEDKSHKRHEKNPEGLKMLEHERTFQETESECTVLKGSNEGPNSSACKEFTPMNILRTVSDTQPSAECPVECLNMATLSQTTKNCDTSTNSENKPQDLEKISLPGDRKQKPVKKTYEYTSVSGIKLTNLQTSTNKNSGKLQETKNCTSKNTKLSEDLDPDSLMSDSASQSSTSMCDKQELVHSNELLNQEPNWNICKCVTKDGCKNCAKKINNKSLPDSHSSSEWNSIDHDDSLEIFEDVELRKRPSTTRNTDASDTEKSNCATCPTCSLKAATARDVIFDGTKAIQCIRYDDDGCITDKQVVPVTKRYSDELNLLLAQLAEITSAPLLSPGVTISLIDFPEKRKHPGQGHNSEFDEWAAIGPIRRRRHSDPDYDVPRPHRSLLQLLLSGRGNEKVDNTDTIEATKFFGKTDPSVIPRPNYSTGNEHELMWPENSQPESCSKNVRSGKILVQNLTNAPSASITPDSLELEQA